MKTNQPSAPPKLPDRTKLRVDNRNRIGYAMRMIKSFKHKGLERFFDNGIKKGIQAKHADRLEDVLDILDAATNIKDMNFPGSGLHQLKGKLVGFWSVKVSGNWRLIFKFRNTDAFEVDYIDYH